MTQDQTRVFLRRLSDILAPLLCGAVGALLVIAILAMSNWPATKGLSEVIASWVQAVGSVAAIFAGFAYASREHKNAQRRDVAARNERARLSRLTALTIMRSAVGPIQFIRVSMAAGRFRSKRGIRSAQTILRDSLAPLGQVVLRDLEDAVMIDKFGGFTAALNTLMQTVEIFARGRAEMDDAEFDWQIDNPLHEELDPAKVKGWSAKAEMIAEARANFNRS